MSRYTNITGDLFVAGNATFEEIQLGVSNQKKLILYQTDLVLDPATGNVIVDDTLTVQDVFTVNNQLPNGDLNHTGNNVQIGNPTQTGNTNITGRLDVVGEATIDEVQIGKVLITKLILYPRLITRSIYWRNNS